MARYMTLLRFTEQGAKNIKNSTSRAHNFADMATKAGVKVEGQYWTTGAYDGTIVLNGDSEKVLRLLTDLAALGNVRTQTMQAFTANEFEAIVGK